MIWFHVTGPQLQDFGRGRRSKQHFCKSIGSLDWERGKKGELARESEKDTKREREREREKEKERERESKREKGGSEREGKSFLKAATKVFSLVRIKIYAKQEFQEEDERKKLLERVVRSKVK